jgi:Holliday junction resolvasome RuvABC endonuclease subunit
MTAAAMVVLGLDQAPNNTGWAVLSDDGVTPPKFGTIVMSDYGDDIQRTLKDFAFELHGLYNEFNPQFVFCEQIVLDERHINLPVLIDQAAIVGAVLMSSAERNIRGYMVEIAVWRKRFLGKSNAPNWAVDRQTKSGRKWLKEAAMNECVRRYFPNVPKNDHEAEAIGIADYGLAFVSHDYRFATKGDVERRRQKRVREDMQA